MVELKEEHMRDIVKLTEDVYLYTIYRKYFNHERWEKPLIEKLKELKKKLEEIGI